MPGKVAGRSPDRSCPPRASSSTEQGGQQAHEPPTLRSTASSPPSAYPVEAGSARATISHSPVVTSSERTTSSGPGRSLARCSPAGSASWGSRWTRRGSRRRESQSSSVPLAAAALAFAASFCMTMAPTPPPIPAPSNAPVFPGNCRAVKSRASPIWNTICATVSPRT